MGRLISLDSTSTQRQRWRRTIAEALKRLMGKASLDQEAKDLSALIVVALREIGAGVEQSATAWDKKPYFLKADGLRLDWEWATRCADRMTRLIHVDDWLRLPVVLAELAPRFADIDVHQLTRSEELWKGAHRRLMAEKGAPTHAPGAAGPGAGRA